MNWFFIALISPALWAIINIIDDNLLRTIYKNHNYATIISGLFGFLPLVLIPFVNVDFQLKFFLFGTISGIILVTCYYFYFKTLMTESPAFTMALWQMSPAFIPILTFIFLGEVLGINQYIGFIIILFASVSLSFFASLKGKTSSSIYLMGIASFLLAISAVIQKYIYLNVNFWTGFLSIGFGMGICGFLFLVFSREDIDISRIKKYSYVFVTAETLNMVAVLISNYAVSIGPVSLVKVIQGVQPLYIILFSIILYPIRPSYFREAVCKKRKLKVFLIIIMIIGLYFIYR